MISTPEKLDKVFGALSDQTRRSILTQLQHEALTVMELADQYDMSFQGVAKHLKVLENAELVTKTKKGRQIICKAEAESLTDALTWISHQHEFWRHNFESLELFLKKQDRQDER